MAKPTVDFQSLPGRLLLDTCVVNLIQDEGEYIFDNMVPDGMQEEELSPDLQAIKNILLVNRRAAFQLLTSPLTIAELANVQDFPERNRRVGWALELLDHWVTVLDDIGDRAKMGGTVRHRFKLTLELQQFEVELMEIPDFRRDPFDRLLLIQYKMGNCDAFLTTDRNTIWQHREELDGLGVRVLSPSEFWDLIRPWSGIWL